MDLNYLSADEMLGAFRRRELSPVEVLDSLIERVAKTSEVNAVAEEMFDEAHDVARAAEARYAGKGPAPRALEGIPVAVKEEMPIAGGSIRSSRRCASSSARSYRHPNSARPRGNGTPTRAHRNSHTFAIWSPVFNGGMDHSASLPARSRRTRRIVIAGLAILGVAIAAFGPVDAVLRILSMPLRSPGWYVWVGTVNGVALITVATLPLAALTVWALARRRSVTGNTPAMAWRMSLAEVGIVYGTVPWVWMIMLAGGQAGAVSLVPLRDLLTMPTSQIVGNLLVFAALGFFAPMRFAALASVWRILALAAGCSVLVEVAQYVLPLNRVSSMDDVLLNAAGAGLAALASRPWWRATATASSDRPRSAPVPGR